MDAVLITRVDLLSEISEEDGSWLQKQSAQKQNELVNGQLLERREKLRTATKVQLRLVKLFSGINLS